MQEYSELGDSEVVLHLGHARTLDVSREDPPVLVRVRECRATGSLPRLEHDLRRWNDLTSERVLVHSNRRGLLVLVRTRYAEQSLSELGSCGTTGRDAFLSAVVAICETLAQVHHQGLVHQNIKPSNLFLPTHGSRLVDPGSEVLLREALNNLRAPYVLDRVLPYLAPEQTGRTGRPIDHRADLYALGVSMYECLSGRRPFASGDPLEVIHGHLARRPPDLREQRPDLPDVVVDIVAKLLEKDPDRRYQSARGLLFDLERCQNALADSDAPSSFPLGERDVSETLVLSGALYGRASERALIEDALADACRGGPCVLMLSGPPGIGKSTLANIITGSAYVRHCTLGFGKCDQLRLDQPYFAIRQAVADVVGQLLLETDTVLEDYRRRFASSVGTMGGVLVELCPELERIVGPQPVCAPLDPQEARARVHLAMERLLAVVTTRERPLVLFLDDLQWADGATLKLIEHVFSRASGLPFLVIGSYRDNEVCGNHPVLLTVRAIRSRGVPVRERTLASLEKSHVAELLADSLGRQVEEVAQLSAVVHEKTLGNPFFVRVFLYSLEAQGLLLFDGQWRWHLDQLQARQVTDNVVTLLYERMRHLPDETRALLEDAALLGSSSALKDSAAVSGRELPALLEALQPAVASGLVRLDEGQVNFLHDRVQEAARAMIDPAQVPARHLRIGRLLMDQLDEDAREERIFELVGHLNAARELLERSDRLALARMNLTALRRAKRSGAFSTALGLAVEGRACLEPEDWESEYALCFALDMEHAELTYHNGDYDQAEELAALVKARASNRVDEAAAHGLLLKQYILQARFDEAIESAQGALDLLGVDFPTDRGDVQSRYASEHARTETLLAGRAPVELLDLPALTDRRAELALELLIRVNPAVFFRRPDMLPLDIALLTNLSLEYGHTPFASFAYAEHGFLCALETTDRRQAYEFASLGLSLAQRFGDPVQLSRSTHLVAWMQHYVRPLREADELFRLGFQAGCESGETEWASYHAYLRTARILLLGDDLRAAQDELERLRDYVKSTNSFSIVQLLDAVLRQVELLTRAPQGADHERTTQALLEEWQAQKNPQAIFLHRAYRSFSLMVERRPEEALAHAEAALSLAFYGPNHPFVELAHFVRGIASLALLESGGDVPNVALEEFERASNLADTCPENYRARLRLLEAELARVRGEGWSNGARYEAACKAAADSGFTHEEGLAHQLAARFWRDLGQQDFATACLHRACGCWQRWGATCQAQTLDRELHEVFSGAVASVDDTVDLRSLIKSSQAISGELDRSRLLLRLMRVIMENAGAERGALFSPGVTGLDPAVTLTADGCENLGADCLIQSKWACFDIVRYVHRTGETLVLSDAHTDVRFSACDEIRRRQVRSVLCMPVRHAELLHGVLYLENALVASAFTRERLAVLEVLVTQASISLENAELFSRTLRAEQTARASEENLRITLDSIGEAVIATDGEGRVARMNPIAEELTGWSMADARGLLLGEVLKMKDGRSQEPIEDPVQEILRTRRVVGPASYAVLVSKDGGERQIAESGAPIRDGQGEMVGVVLVLRDMTEHGQLEERLRQSQKMDALGQLAGGVAHDFNNMLTGILGSAELIGFQLRGRALPETLEALQTIMESAERAADLTRQLLVFSRKGRRGSVPLAIHEIIEGALALLERSVDPRIRIERRFEAGDAVVSGDSALLQSALLNVAINARDAMPAGGTLNVRTDRVLLKKGDSATGPYDLKPGYYVEINVCDDGTGIDPSVIDRVFEPFFTTKGVGVGTGLGLAAVHGTMVQHGGCAHIESALGIGTTVTLRLPLVEVELPKRTRIKTPAPRAQNLRVLLVEDESVTQTTTRRVLESLGHTVVVANDGRDGVAVFAAKHADLDLVVLDSVMPRMSGPDAFREIHVLDPTVPVLLFSGSAHGGVVEQLKASGLAGFLMKPFTRATLVATIDNVTKPGGPDQAT